MGFKKGGDDFVREISKSAPLSEDGILFATMCIVGLPVEVQIKDGSVYSGIFHTACVEKGYDIILKTARKIGKGKRESNLAIRDLVDTLLVHSGDLVQVVVKDFLLPAEGIIDNVAGDCVEAATETIKSQTCNIDSEREPKSLISGNNSPFGILDHNKEQKYFDGPGSDDAKVLEGLDVREVLLNPLENKQEVVYVRHDSICPVKVEEPSLATISSVQERQVGKDMPQGEANSCTYIDEVSSTNKMLHEDDCTGASSDVCLPQVDTNNGTHGDITSKKTSNGTRCGSPDGLLVSPEALKNTVPISTNIQSSDAQTSTVSTSSTSVSDVRTSSCPSLSTSPNLPVPKKNSGCNTNAKEFKLNPQAEAFSPSFANSRSAPTAVPTVASTGYTSSTLPVIPIAAAQSGVEICTFANCPSLPTKLAQYNSVVAGHSGVTSQYSRPVVGYAGARQQPVRFSGHYQPVQPGPAYVHPTSQAIMVGRTGQLVYVHPISQDAIQGTAVLSQGSPYPFQANMPKIQGSTPHSVQLCITPPLMSGAAQPYAVPSHIPFSPPFPAVRPIPVPGGNGFFGSKFQ